MKKCNTCLVDKPPTKYTKNKAVKDGLSRDCRDCKNNKERGRYRDPKSTQRYNAEAHQRRKLRYYTILDKYVSRECTWCGFTHKYWAPFDFHHIDETTKEYELSSMVRHTEENIKAELDKCIVLCSICHRVHHYEEKSNEKD